jgi:cytochrome b subunit of formate dehydrogenase
MGDALRGFLAMFGAGEEPVHGKFKAKQRIIYALMVGTSVTLMITGLIKSFKNLGPIILDPFFLQIIAFVHTGVGMLFMLLVIAHVGALLLKQHRPMIPSMFTGRIRADYAHNHHPAWEPE